MKKKTKTLIIITAVLVLLLLAAVLIISHYLGSINREDPSDFEPTPAPIESLPPVENDPYSDEETRAQIEPFLDDDLLNILLVGQDARPGEGRQRSDSMIVCSINLETKEVSLISFLRDLYVEIPGSSPNRLNTPYVYGGFELLKETLRHNFGISIDGCFEVNFDGFETVIDIVGGVDIKLTASEAQIVGVEAKEEGNHLNGEQTLTYSRIRSLDSDFMRTERQRNVLMSVLRSARGRSFKELAALAEEMLPHMTTDLSKLQIMSMLFQCYKIMDGATVTPYRVPADNAYYYDTIRGMSVVVPNLPLIREQLETYLPLNEK